MARLASQEKMDYYPTPIEVVQKIKQLLQIPQQARLIDTCCGEGDALALVAEGTGAVTYGVELDKERYKAAKQRLDHVLWCDALNELICTREAFSLLWLNPPYDTEEGGELDKKERLELLFLKKHFSLLQKGGVLVLIIPYRVLADCLEFLQHKCTNLNVYRFPDSYFWEFKQVVVIGVRGRPSEAHYKRNTRLIELASSFTYPAKAYESLDSIETADTNYRMPEAEKESVIFKSSRLDPDEAIKLVKTSPLWNQIKQMLTPKSLSFVRPLMPLREGHLAMLLASGMMNGEVRGKERLIIKGSVKKVQDKTEEKTADGVKITKTDRYEITVRAIRFTPEPEIITIR